jgi:hypothetical protein
VEYLNGEQYPIALISQLAVLRFTYIPPPNRKAMSEYYNQLIPDSSLSKIHPNKNPKELPDKERRMRNPIQEKKLEAELS